MGLTHGIDASGYLVPLLVDATGKAIVTGTVTVQGTSSDKLLSLGDVIYGSSDHGDLAAGSQYHTIFTVPAGHYYHIGNGSMTYGGTVTTVELDIIIKHGASRYAVQVEQNLTTWIARNIVLDLFVAPTDLVELFIANATLHDQCYLSMVGHLLHTT